MSEDYLIRARAAKEQIRAFAVTDRGLVDYARTIHHNESLATAALGRLRSAGLRMGARLKSPSDKLTLQLLGDGPLKHVIVTSNYKGEVRGYVSNPAASLPLRADGHLDVGGGIGKGVLTVIRDLGRKEPYSSTINLHSGEIADDLTYYFAQSEQTPTAIGLGVLLEKQRVSAAGGFIVQLRPNTDPKVIDKLEENLKHIPSVTEILKAGKTPEQRLDIVLDGFDHEITAKEDVFWHCNCSQERGKEVIGTLGTDAIKERIAKNEPIEATCDFCGKTYKYSVEDLKGILSRLGAAEQLKK